MAARNILRPNAWPVLLFLFLVACNDSDLKSRLSLGDLPSNENEADLKFKVVQISGEDERSLRDFLNTISSKEYLGVDYFLELADCAPETGAGRSIECWKSIAPSFFSTAEQRLLEPERTKFLQYLDAKGDIRILDVSLDDCVMIVVNDLADDERYQKCKKKDGYAFRASANEVTFEILSTTLLEHLKRTSGEQSAPLTLFAGDAILRVPLVSISSYELAPTPYRESVEKLPYCLSFGFAAIFLEYEEVQPGALGLKSKPRSDRAYVCVNVGHEATFDLSAGERRRRGATPTFWGPIVIGDMAFQ